MHQWTIALQFSVIFADMLYIKWKICHENGAVLKWTCLNFFWPLAQGLGLGRGISVTIFAHLWASLEADVLAVLPLVEVFASVIYGSSLY